MIMHVDSNSKKEQLHDDSEAPPPSYSESDTPTGSTINPTFKSKPTNYLSLSHSDCAIRGEFVIDPSIRIPSSVLPPLQQGESEDDRKNLCLRSRDSSVHADIWLLGSSSESKPRRTSIALTSDHGSIRAQLHTLDGAAPYVLTARAKHGTIRLALPPSFQGLLCLSTRHGSISLSDAIVQNLTQLSQVDDMRRYFVGDFNALGEDAWQGDQIDMEALHGSLHLKYTNEEAEGQSKKGLFSRLFGK